MPFNICDNDLKLLIPFEVLSAQVDHSLCLIDICHVVLDQPQTARNVASDICNKVHIPLETDNHL